MIPSQLPSAFWPTLAGCIAAILAFDALGAAFVRRNPSLRYGSMWPLQFACYVVFGFVAMFALLDIRLAALIGAVTGFVEATLGWFITWRIGPGRQAAATPASIFIAVFSMAAFGFGLALVGAFVLDLVVLISLRMHH